MLIQIFVLKVINNERKILTHHEMIDRMAEQIESVITQECKQSNFLAAAKFLIKFFI